jgi:acyl-CoA thioesterase-1
MNNRHLILAGTIGIGLLAWWLWPSVNDQVISDIRPRTDTTKPETTIIAFGDSLTAGYGLTASEAYPAQLETSLLGLGYDVAVINAGVSGETTRGNLERASFIRSQNPDVVLLGIGGNDALRLLPFSETEKNLRQTIETLQSGENPPVVILLRMQAPLTAGLSYKRDFDSLYEDLANEYRLVLVPFLTAELFLDSANKLSDGIHYNAEGYRQVVQMYLLPALTQVLDKLMPH